MPGLFDQQEQSNLEEARPLAARMRPQNLNEFIGQSHFLGEGKLLRRMLKADRLGSLIFYGPPGTRKDVAGGDHRPADEVGLRAAQCGLGRREGSAGRPRTGS